MVHEVTNVHQEKGMRLKVNETHVRAVYKIEILHYFRFTAEGLIFNIYAINFNFTSTG